jgi:hypothetical protein
MMCAMMKQTHRRAIMMVLIAVVIVLIFKVVQSANVIMKTFGKTSLLMDLTLMAVEFVMILLVQYLLLDTMAMIIILTMLP